jgi:hypothetical protein
MSEPNTSAPPGDEDPPEEAGDALQFDQAEFATPAGDGPACTVCHQPIADEYFELGGKVFCARCREGVEAAFRGGSGFARVIKALLFGSVAAIVGALIYYTVIRVTHINSALISILVGFIVGSAVRKGSGNRGGSFYQALAIFLTYSSIVAMNIPFVIEAFLQKVPPPSPEVIIRMLVAVIGPLCRIPIENGLQRPISGLIYAFALWEAWKINRPLVLAFNGPFRLSTTVPDETAPEVIDHGT